MPIKYKTKTKPGGIIYIKSFEEDFSTKTLLGKKKTICQTVYQIVKAKKILPNTKSFGRKKRLACTILHKNYLKTYRPQGLIFRTKQKPGHIFPFDLAVLSATDSVIVNYYRIKNNLHFYYNNKLIEGFEKFIYGDFGKMIRSISSPKKALKKVNYFRKTAGFAGLPNGKKRLVEYNEAVFEKPVKIKTIAIFGRTKKARAVARELNLPCYKSAKEFYTKAVQK